MKKVRYEVVAKAGDELVIREPQSELMRRKSENVLPSFVKILRDFCQWIVQGSLKGFGQVV